MWLSNAVVVLPDQVLECGSVQIEHGVIADVIEGPPPRPAIDCQGLHLLPGIIDMHGDMIESELQPRPGVYFPVDLAIYELDKRLASNGITTAYASVSFWGSNKAEYLRSVDYARNLVQTVHALHDTLLIDLLIHARYEVATPNVAAAVIELLDAGQVHLLSLMDHTPGQGQYRDRERYIENIAKWRDMPRAQIEAELEERIRQSQAEQGWQIAAALVDKARQQGVIIASHDDDTEQKVAHMASLGVTICEFPVTLAAARYAREHNMHTVMGAPNVLRGGSHSGNLSALEALDAGAVDMLAADYAPTALLQAVFILAQRGMPLPAAAALVSSTPAEALGLVDRGRIVVGQAADLVLVEAGNNPRVRGTLRRGTPIYWDGTMARRSAIHHK